MLNNLSFPLDPDLNNDPSIDLRPFPTLVEVLERVHPNVGINIEIKFPQMDAVSHPCL